MWPAEHIFGTLMILVLIGLLAFTFWFWSRETPNKEPTRRQMIIYSVVFALLAIVQGFEAWRDVSVGYSGWYWHLVPALGGSLAAVGWWRKANTAQ